MQDSDSLGLLQEAVDRARRIETRITKVANHLGVDAGGKMPELSADRTRILVPSRKTSIDDILLVAPGDQSVEVYCGNDYLFTLVDDA